MRDLLSYRFLLICALSACFQGLPPDGSLRCAPDPDHPCPSGFYCATNGTCWRTGHGPDFAISPGDGGMDGGGDASALVDGGSLDQAVADLRCQNLQCMQMACDGGSTTVSGVVYAPNGTLPLYNALVYVPNGTVETMPTGFTQGSCPTCFATASGSPVTLTTSGVDGSFHLSNVPAGDDIPLVIQMGRWRRQIPIHVTACGDVQLSADQTRLPRDQGEGDIPLIAVATSNADGAECALWHAGLELGEYTGPQGSGRVHVYAGTGGQILAYDGGAASGTITQLLGVSSEWLRHDIVILDCEGSEKPRTTGQEQAFLDFTSAGGRAFLFHYGYVYLQPSPFASAANLAPGGAYSASPIPATIDQSFPKGLVLASWLDRLGGASGSMITLTNWRNDVSSTNVPTQSWLAATPSGTAIQQLTFAAPPGPTPGCGYVVYSDFHSEQVPSSNLHFPSGCSSVISPQEQELLFHLFDQPTCVP